MHVWGVWLSIQSLRPTKDLRTTETDVGHPRHEEPPSLGDIYGYILEETASGTPPTFYLYLNQCKVIFLGIQHLDRQETSASLLKMPATLV